MSEDRVDEEIRRWNAMLAAPAMVPLVGGLEPLLSSGSAAAAVRRTVELDAVLSTGPTYDDRAAADAWFDSAVIDGAETVGRAIEGAVLRLVDSGRVLVDSEVVPRELRAHEEHVDVLDRHGSVENAAGLMIGEIEREIGDG